MAEDLIDPRRSEPTMQLGERPMLEDWLEFHRTTLLLKVEGLDDVQRKARPIESSAISLHGLVRHLVEVERWWFQAVLQARDVPEVYCTDDEPDGDWFPLDDAVWEDDLARWQAECEVSRELAAAKDLDDSGVHPTLGPCSLRWIYVHMIEEYARHNGHADLVREQVDGEVGC
jgi:uncharacterized damage-inducible protein DinB